MGRLTEEQLTEVWENAGVHGKEGPVGDGSDLLADYDHRLYYGLLELLDFDCVSHNCAPEGVTEEAVKAYLTEHHEKITMKALPSAVGLYAGTFAFLADDSE